MEGHRTICHMTSPNDKSSGWLNSRNVERNPKWVVPFDSSDTGDYNGVPLITARLLLAEIEGVRLQLLNTSDQHMTPVWHVWFDLSGWEGEVHVRIVETWDSRQTS